MAESTGTDRGPVYFWGEKDAAVGFLSQWYVAAFTDDKGVEYVSAEMWMMVKKAELFGDIEIAAEMLKTRSPAEHKKLGRKVKGFDRDVWDEHKLRIVEQGSYLKFTAGSKSGELRALLLGTGERELVEASPYDRIWGIGFHARDADAARESGAWGENLLGIALMNVRKRLREEEQHKGGEGAGA